MESVGQKLREARLRKNIGLDAISSDTRITIRNLEAIEADQVEFISSRFTYRSFVRQFAKAVDLNWPGLEAALSDMAERLPAPLVPGQDGAPVPPAVPGLRPPRTHKLRWAFSTVSLAAMLALCSSFYGVWENARSDLRGSLKNLVASMTVHAAKPATPKAAATAQVQVSSVPVASPTAMTPSGFQIQLSAVESCWLSVVTDGKEVFSGILQTSETKVLAGQEEARIRAGNAGGVEVNFNGRSLGPLGKRGEVRTVVFTKNGYEVLQPQPHMALTSFGSTPAGE